MMRIAALLLGSDLVCANAAESDQLKEANRVWDAIKTFGRPENQLSASSGFAKKNRAREAEKSLAQADQLRNFYTRYPAHPSAVEAKWREAFALNRAAFSGDSSQERRRLQLIEAIRSDFSIAEIRRFEVVAWSRQVSIVRQKPTERAVYLQAQEEITRALIAEFPAVEHGYGSLLALARDCDPARGETIARDLLAMPKASAAVKLKAERVIGRCGLIGQSIDAIFVRHGAGELVASRENKVTVVYAWSSQGLPMLRVLRQLAERFPAVCFIGVCLDGQIASAAEFVVTGIPKGLQHHDPKGAEGALAQALYLELESVVLVADRFGTIRDVHGKENFSAKVAALLK